MATSPGNVLVLDGDDVTVVETIRVTEGTGEDAESWPLLVLDAGGDELLVEDYEGKLTLYERADGPPAGARQVESASVRFDAAAAGASTRGAYWEGVTPSGDSVLMLPRGVYVEDDALVRRGDGWLARAHTPARRLRPRPTGPTGAGGAASAALDLAVAAALPAYAAAHLFAGAPGFRAAWWILGIAALAASRLSVAFPLSRTARLWSFAFGLWLCTDLASHLAPPAVAEAWDVGRALFFLLAAWPPFLMHRRLFFVVADAARAAAAGAAAVFTAGLGLVAMIDEDLSWLVDWGHYFGDPWWAWLWPLGVVVAIRHCHRDYRDAPLDGASFEALRARTVDALRSGRFADDLTAAGRLLDDLSDGVCLCEDRSVRALSDHVAELKAAAAAFGGAARKVGADLRGSGLDAGQVLDDARVLADDLEAMAPGGPGLRVSPLLSHVGKHGPD